LFEENKLGWNYSSISIDNDDCWVSKGITYYLVAKRAEGASLNLNWWV